VAGGRRCRWPPDLGLGCRPTSGPVPGDRAPDGNATGPNRRGRRPGSRATAAVRLLADRCGQAGVRPRFPTVNETNADAVAPDLPWRSTACRLAIELAAARLRTLFRRPSSRSASMPGSSCSPAAAVRCRGHETAAARSWTGAGSCCPGRSRCSPGDSPFSPGWGHAPRRRNRCARTAHWPRDAVLPRDLRPGWKSRSSPWPRDDEPR